MAYSCNAIVIDSDNKIIINEKDNACFGFLNKQWNSNITAKVWKYKKDVPFTEEEVTTFIQLLSNLKFFKVELEITDDKYFFILKDKDYSNRVLWLSTLTILRYLWESKYGGYMAFTPITEYFLKLCSKYPEQDILYNLILAHYVLIDSTEWYYDSHALISDIKSNFYPIKESNLKLSSFGSVHGTFTIRIKQEYNKTVEEYKQLIKEL